MFTAPVTESLRRDVPLITSLPKWVEYGAFVLAFIAGCVNAVGLLGFQHQAISHVSGTVTLVATTALTGAPGQVLHLVGVLLSFVLGACVSGFTLSGSSLKLGRHYDVLLLVEAGMLLAAMGLLSSGSASGHYLASAACGLQNALATTYSGAVVRTTHLTGIFTDLGIMLGATIRGKTFDRRKAILFVIIAAGFATGSSCGAWLFLEYGFWSLGAPAGICIGLALTYRAFNARTQSHPG